MKAWQIIDQRKLSLITEESEDVKEGCVKVLITRSLISRPSLRAYTEELSSLPIITGNACSGMVVEVGENVQNLERGDRVYISPLKSCGECSTCKSGKFYACDNALYRGIDTDGLARDFIVLREDECIKIPDRIGDSEAVFLGYIAAAIQVINAIEVERGEHIAIYGAGALGNIIAQTALYYQAVPILIDIDASYLEKAKNMGVYYTINAVDSDPRTKIFHITGGKMAECAAHVASKNYELQQTLSLVGTGGRVAIVGRNFTSTPLNCSLKPLLANRLMIKGINGGLKNLEMAINLLANKAVNVLPLITKEVPFDELPDAMENAANSTNPYTKIILQKKI